MAYRDLNSDRFFFLLAKGTHEGELKRFFTESKRQLLLKQARVQNLPYGRVERIRSLCDRLPRSTDDIVRAWFHSNITMAEPASVEDVLSEFSLYEQMDEPIPEERGKQLARSALVHLFDDDPSPALIMFLKSRIGDAVGHEPLDDPSSVEEQVSEFFDEGDGHRAESVVADSEAEDHLATLLSAVIVGDEQAIDEALAPYTDGIQTLVDALMSARSGDMARAVLLSESLAQNSHEHKLLQKALSQARHRPGSVSTVSSGLRVMAPKPLKEQADISQFDIIGVCSNETDKAVFVRPLALVAEGNISLITAEERIRLFPESGDVMSHRTSGRHLPHRGDIVRWEVEERDVTVGKTRFHYVDEPSFLIEVVNVPFPSSEPDEVRSYIKELMSSKKSVSPRYPLFALSDGVAIAPPKSCDPKRDDAFEQPWQSWGSLEVWVFEGRQVSMGMPEVPASQLDLSPLETAFKKLVKNIAEEKKVTITKSQVRDLSALIRNQQVGEASLRAARVADALDRVILDSQSLEDILPLISSREDVRRRVDGIVEQHVAEKLKERAGLNAELEVLRNRNDELRRESKELERRIKKRSGEIDSSVGKAFSRAIEDGVASLAQAEIFRVLTSASKDRSTSSGGKEGNSHDLVIRQMQGALSKDAGISRLVALGVNRRQAIALVVLAQVTAKAKGCLVLRGHEARQLVRVLGRIDSSLSGILEIPMGLTSSAPVRKALMDVMHDLDTIVVLDADLSPIEAYASPLLDDSFDAATGEISGGARVFLSCLGGDMALQLPRSIRRVAVVIDLDSQWDKNERQLAELEEEDVQLLKPIYAALVEEVGRLQGAERTVVESVLATTLQATAFR
ncbi:coiled-coil domain-containing protein [Luteimonas sp. RIT-PG2_3]